MRKNIIFISALLMFMACGGKKTQTEIDDAAVADSTVVDSTVVAVAKPYDLEAIAKAIEGCESLQKFNHGVARVTKDGQRFYIDLQGNIVEKPQVEEEPRELTCDYEKGKYGFKDSKGNLVIPHKFHFAHDFSDGMAIVVNEKGLVGYINTNGELAIPYQYGTMAESDGNNFHEGLCAVLVDDEYEWFSYVDKTGKLAFEGVFSYAGNFSEGLAAVRIRGGNSRSGYIDSSGKMVIELPDGWWGRQFKDGAAQIQRADSCYIIDKTGKRLFQVNSSIIYTGNDIVYSEGLAVVYGKGKYEGKNGFMDKAGRITFCLSEDKADAHEQDKEAVRAFVEKFYEEWGMENLLEYGYLKRHITPNLLKYLADSYEFDCEGECLATWKFFYEGGGDVGKMVSRQISARDENHVLVESKYENYEYDVLLTVIKDGDTFKIDSLKQERSEY